MGPAPGSAADQRPRIAVVGANGCLNAGHIEALRALGTASVAGPLDEAHAIDRLKGIDILIANPYIVPLNRAVIESTDALKLVLVDVTGLDRVDLDAACAKAIRVANVPGYSTEAVAEHTFGLPLANIRHVAQGDTAVRHGQFQTAKDDETVMGFELAGKTLGVLGLGSIGIQVAEIGRGFGMNVIAWDRSAKNLPGITQVPLELLLTQSDVVSMNVALTRDTAGMLNAARLHLMKPTAILIKTARGELVDESALYEALRAGKLGGAGRDVLAVPELSNPLLHSRQSPSRRT